MLVEGVLIAAPGELSEPRLAAIASVDGAAGIFLLVVPTEASMQRGDIVRVGGALTLRRQALTIVATGSAERLGSAPQPVALSGATTMGGTWGWERWEARRLRLVGRLAGAATALSGGALSLRLRLPDGSDLPLAAAAPIAVAIPHSLRAAGREVVVTGVLHQRGGSAGGGYRLWIDPVAGIVPKPPSAPAGGARVGGGTARSAPVAQLPLGAPSVALPRAVGLDWIRAAAGAIGISSEGLSLRGKLRIRLVTMGGHDSCSATHGRALTVRGGLPILTRGDGSWGSSGLPGSTRSACGRPMKAPRGGGVARSLL